jgi:hypothetical protein
MNNTLGSPTFGSDCAVVIELQRKAISSRFGGRKSS